MDEQVEHRSASNRGNVKTLLNRTFIQGVQTDDLRGSRCAFETAIPIQFKAQSLGQLGGFRGATQLPFNSSSLVLAMPDKLPYGPRQMIEAAQIVEHRPSDAVLGQSLKLAAALRSKSIHGLNQSDDAGRDQIVQLDLMRTSPMEAGGQEPNLRQVAEDDLFTVQGR